MACVGYRSYQLCGAGHLVFRIQIVELLGSGRNVWSLSVGGSRGRCTLRIPKMEIDAIGIKNGSKCLTHSFLKTALQTVFTS
jgi:hypothetical protein